MMYRLCSKFTIGNYTFNFTNDVAIESTWENLTDTATIIIPKNLTANNKPIVDGANSIFKIGDVVKIELGYDYKFDTVFEGYLTDIKLKYPLELKCEDKMYLFKRLSFPNISYKTVTVKTLVDMMISKLPTSIKAHYTDGDISLGKFRIGKAATGAQVFEELRKKYGIYSFFREGELYVGFAYTHADSTYRKVIPFQFQFNIIEDSLIYKNKDNYKIKVKAVSISADNKETSVEVGDGDGVLIERFYYNSTVANLTKFANDVKNSYKYSGFTGTFTTFGKPYVRQGDAVKLVDTKIAERNGVYLVKKVTRLYGQDGYRQEIELDRKIS